MCKSQAKYKSEYDRRAIETTSFRVGSYVFVDETPLLPTLEPSATVLTSNTYNKLRQLTTRPYRISDVRTYTTTIGEYGIPNTVSIDRVTHAPSPQRASLHQVKPHKTRLLVSSRVSNTHAQNKTGKTDTPTACD